MGGNGKEELKKKPPPSPGVLWIVNVRERKSSIENKLVGDFVKNLHWIPNPGVPWSKPLGGSKVDSAFHPSEVDKMSTRSFWEISGKK